MTTAAQSMAGPATAEETLAERLIADLAVRPADYADAAALARAAGMDAAELRAMLVRQYHAPPEDLLARARVATLARGLRDGNAPLRTLAATAGLANAGAAAALFRRAMALSPAAYRAMLAGAEFTLALPATNPLDRLLAYLGRDQHSLTERVAGRRFTLATVLDAGPAPVAAIAQVDLAPGRARCAVLRPATLSAADRAQLHGRLRGALGLACAPAPFERLVRASRDLRPLIAGQAGLRVPLTSDPFSGLVWAIVGQQITVAFAKILRRRLVERAGVPLADGLWAPPTPAAVAALRVEDLTSLQFSRSKADYLIGAARLVAAGALPLEDMAAWPATRVERTLLAVRGIGPWSAHYLMMRVFGFPDCVPLGDTGLMSGLQRFFALAERPDARATLALMERFRPYRSLATLHLWQRLDSDA